jgi:hypothetical protein
VISIWLTQIEKGIPENIFVFSARFQVIIKMRVTKRGNGMRAKTTPYKKPFFSS